MLRRTFASLLFLAPFAKLAGAAEPEVFTGLVEGFGAGGYDVVSFFSNTPTDGKDEFTSEWKGAKWRFSSAANLQAFVAAPEQYAPQYGGYCAYAVSKGYTAKGIPEAWTVHDGKLYLNYSKAVRATWAEDIPGNIAAANSNWPKVLE
jgi:YHS domain-containing protein